MQGADEQTARRRRTVPALHLPEVRLPAHHEVGKEVTDGQEDERGSRSAFRARRRRTPQKGAPSMRAVEGRPARRLIERTVSDK